MDTVRREKLGLAPTITTHSIIADRRDPPGAGLHRGGPTGRVGLPSLRIGPRPRPETRSREDREPSGRCARTDGGTVSQMRTVASPEAEASLVPSGLKATA